MIQRKLKINSYIFLLSAIQATIPNGTASAQGPYPMPILVRFRKMSSPGSKVAGNQHRRKQKDLTFSYGMVSLSCRNKKTKKQKCRKES